MIKIIIYGYQIKYFNFKSCNPISRSHGIVQGRAAPYAGYAIRNR